MLVYKINVLETLKENGFNTTKIRKEKIFSEGTLTDFRNGKVVSANNLDKLCKLLDMQPGNIIKYIEDDTN